MNFNPRTHRGVRLQYRDVLFYKYVISIHAPIVGCDYNVLCNSMLLTISIHAPIVGCDEYNKKQKRPSRNFNPRTHRGVRHYIRTLKIRAEIISIHAPIVGCDKTRIPRSSARLIFQSTHPSWGATFYPIPSETIEHIFQSTHPSWGATICS